MASAAVNILRCVLGVLVTTVRLQRIFKKKDGKRDTEFSMNF